MVFHCRYYHLIALFHELLRERRSHKIKTLCGAAGENNLLYLLCINELTNIFTGSLMQVGGLLREIMNTAVNIRIDVVVFLSHSIHHHTRLLRGSRIVEIYQRFAIHLAAQYREFFPHFIYIVHLLY